MDDADALSGDSLVTYLCDYDHVFSGEAYFYGAQPQPSNRIKCEMKTKLQYTKEVHVYVILSLNSFRGESWTPCHECITLKCMLELPEGG